MATLLVAASLLLIAGMLAGLALLAAAVRAVSAGEDLVGVVVEQRGDQAAVAEGGEEGQERESAVAAELLAVVAGDAVFAQPDEVSV